MWLKGDFLYQVLKLQNRKGETAKRPRHQNISQRRQRTSERSEHTYGIRQKADEKKEAPEPHRSLRLYDQ